MNVNLNDKRYFPNVVEINDEWVISEINELSDTKLPLFTEHFVWFCDLETAVVGSFFDNGGKIRIFFNIFLASQGRDALFLGIMEEEDNSFTFYSENGFQIENLDDYVDEKKKWMTTWERTSDENYVVLSNDRL